MTGVPKDQLEQLAQLYADPNKKVISYWTMGFNQHTQVCGPTTWSTTCTC